MKYRQLLCLSFSSLQAREKIDLPYVQYVSAMCTNAQRDIFEMNILIELCASAAVGRDERRAAPPRPAFEGACASLKPCGPCAASGGRRAAARRGRGRAVRDEA